MSHWDLESELIQRAVSGDRTALSQLLLMHYDALSQRISARLSSELQGLIRAEDILQLTFIRATQAIGRYEPRGNHAFRGWLRTIADNLVQDAFRQRQRELRRPPGDQRPAGEQSGSAGKVVEQFPADLTSPSRQVRTKETIQRMLTAVNRLPEEHREVIRRRYLDGESLDHIARHMGYTKEAIRGLCYRARKRLRTNMGRSSLYFSG